MRSSRELYSVLGVRHDAAPADVRRAYKRKALQCHPDRNPVASGAARRAFQEISAAYDVLNDPVRRLWYDVFGELPSGVADCAPSSPRAGTPCQDAAALVAQLFQRELPGNWLKEDARPRKRARKCHDDSRRASSPMPSAAAAAATPAAGSAVHDDARHLPTPAQQPKSPAERHELPCTLEELLHGCTKRMHVTRRCTLPNGSLVAMAAVLEVHVQPGWRQGTAVTFEKMGGAQPGMQPADVVLTLAELPHPLFRREGNDLVHVAQLSLERALEGGDVQVPVLEGGSVAVALHDMVRPGTERVIAGRGMPLCRHPSRRGDLRVRFEVVFPVLLSPAQRSHAVSALRGGTCGKPGCCCGGGNDAQG